MGGGAEMEQRDGAGSHLPTKDASLQISWNLLQEASHKMMLNSLVDNPDPHWSAVRQPGLAPRSRGDAAFPWRGNSFHSHWSGRNRDCSVKSVQPCLVQESCEAIK